MKTLSKNLTQTAIKQENDTYNFRGYTIIKSSQSYTSNHTKIKKEIVWRVYNNQEEICSSPFFTKKEAIKFLSK